MRRGIGADRLAHVTEGAGISYCRKILTLCIIYCALSGAVDKAEQPWKAVAEITAAAALVTHAEGAPYFPIKRISVEELSGVPVNGGPFGPARRYICHAGTDAPMITSGNLMVCDNTLWQTTGE